MTTLLKRKSSGVKSTDQNPTPGPWLISRVKKVVLYFYPEDDTPTCTVQAANSEIFGLLKQKVL